MRPVTPREAIEAVNERKQAAGMVPAMSDAAEMATVGEARALLVGTDLDADELVEAAGIVALNLIRSPVFLTSPPETLLAGAWADGFVHGAVFAELQRRRDAEEPRDGDR